MSQQNRPISPFMLGPHYRPQLTSMMSIAHRASGVLLSVVGAPLLLWWLVALGSGPDAYGAMAAYLGGVAGKAVLALCALSLCYHLFNGIRHLVWDSGHALEISAAYRAGWLVLIATVLGSAVLLGVLL